MTARETPLRPDQFDRYRRHLTLPEIGLEGQQRLLEGSVLLIGAGGLGCPSAQYLAAAGVGRIGLVDDDVVSASNLQRQILYATADVGRTKVEVAKERLQGLNPDVRVDAFRLRLDSSNALELFEPYDVIVDGTDNFPTRYLTNDACVLLGKPNVHGSIFRFEGQASVFDSTKGPCYRCLYPEPPPPGAVPSCAEGGVLGILPGTVGLVQATEAVKILAGIGDPLHGRLLHYDALEMTWREFKLQKDPECPICGEKPTIEALIDYEGFCGMPAREGIAPAEMRQCSASELAARRASDASLVLLDVREAEEVETASIEGARWIPLAELEARIGELIPLKEEPIIVHCHHGGRSEKAVRLLLERGFARAENLDGGIEAWSLTVDPLVPRY
ncbi:MAG: molybdenum cofactor biosynthesis protein MoeB [Deltaproteobacteria bacterium]|nr:molybdenum cofactor biosynthesis protein MoeB [Deltaproteobacteria bacterium]